MAIAVAETRKVPGLRSIRSMGTLTFSGNYVAGGEVANIPKPGTTKAPYDVDIRGQSGFEYRYDRATGKVKVMGPVPTDATAGTVALAEIAAAAYPAGVTGDVVYYDAEFPKLG